MPDNTPERQPFDGLNFIRRILPTPEGVPPIEPDNAEANMPLPPPAAQTPEPSPPTVPIPTPAPAGLPPLPAGQIPGGTPPAAEERPGSTHFPNWDWGAINRAPGYHSMANEVRTILSGYTTASMESMSICLPYDRSAFTEMLQDARERMIEMALPPTLSHVSTGAYMGGYGRNDIDVFLFTDANRTESLLYTSRPIPMIYRWEGGPRAELNVPVEQVQANNATTPVVEVPDIFTREIPHRPVFHHDPISNHYFQIGGDQAQTPDIVDNDAAAAQRRETWLPATLMPGYTIEPVRAATRALIARFSDVPMEQMQVLVANLHGANVVSETFADTTIFTDGVQVPNEDYAVTLAGSHYNAFLHTTPNADDALLYLDGPTTMLVKFGGPLRPEVAAFPRYTPGAEQNPNRDAAPDDGMDLGGPGL